MKVASDDFKMWVDGSLKFNAGGPSAGGVAFGGEQPKFDNLKIGYDNTFPPDDDIDDAGDDIVVDENFGSTSVTVSHDHAGNLIDDGTFRNVYDAWNRLLAVKSSKDSGATTVQTAEFDGIGRRLKKVVTASGDYDGTVVYLFGGVAAGASAGRIIETRDGRVSHVLRAWVHDCG